MFENSNKLVALYCFNTYTYTLTLKCGAAIADFRQ